jgi:hypothetical protein
MDQFKQKIITGTCKKKKEWLLKQQDNKFKIPVN